MDHLTINNCNENPLDPSCYCYGNGPSHKYKIYDMATSEYLCCGTIHFDLDAEDPFSSAANLDDSRCLGWWVGSSNNKLTTDNKIPEIGKDFYLPDDHLIQGLTSVSYGPNDQDLASINKQSKISKLFTKPKFRIQDSTSVVNYCEEGNLYWLGYDNPNVGASTNFRLVCVQQNIDSLETSSSDDWALFKPICENYGTDKCITTGFMEPTSEFIGINVFKTNTYTGGSSYQRGVLTAPQQTREQTQNNSNAGMWLIMIVIILLFVVAIVVVIVWINTSNPNEASKIDMFISD